MVDLRSVFPVKGHSSKRSANVKVLVCEARLAVNRFPALHRVSFLLERLLFVRCAKIAPMTRADTAPAAPINDNDVLVGITRRPT